jgi:GntR family transcriptional regulator
MSQAVWKAIADTVCTRIADGTYPPRSRIPTYRQMADEHFCSLTPVRVAYAQLRRAGVLDGHGGRGVFVAACPLLEVAVVPLPLQIAGMLGELTALRERVAQLEGLLAGPR